MNKSVFLISAISAMCADPVIDPPAAKRGEKKYHRSAYTRQEKHDGVAPENETRQMRRKRERMERKRVARAGGD